MFTISTAISTCMMISEGSLSLYMKREKDGDSIDFWIHNFSYLVISMVNYQMTAGSHVLAPFAKYSYICKLQTNTCTSIKSNTKTYILQLFITAFQHSSVQSFLVFLHRTRLSNLLHHALDKHPNHDHHHAAP